MVYRIIEHDGIERECIVHVPENADGPALHEGMDIIWDFFSRYRRTMN
jgi:hypothetical protein